MIKHFLCILSCRVLLDQDHAHSST